MEVDLSDLAGRLRVWRKHPARLSLDDANPWPVESADENYLPGVGRVTTFICRDINGRRFAIDVRNSILPDEEGGHVKRPG